MSASGHHPVDRYSRSAAQTTNAANLTECFEQACSQGKIGDVEMIGAVAIARVRLLETQMDVDKQYLLAPKHPPEKSNVVQLRSARSQRLKPRSKPRPKGPAA